MSVLVRNRLFNLIKGINNNLRIHRYKVPMNIHSYSSIFLNQQINIFPINLNLYRHKHNKKNEKQDFTESEDESEDEIVDKHSKIISAKVNSLRADVILKAGLGIARNKIEVLFYESKIRVNGRKFLKKSASLNVGDEIDIIKGTSSSNPDFLVVARVELLSVSERNEGLNVKLRRNKSLIIENYSDIAK